MIVGIAIPSKYSEGRYASLLRTIASVAKGNAPTYVAVSLRGYPDEAVADILSLVNHVQLMPETCGNLCEMTDVLVQHMIQQHGSNLHTVIYSDDDIVFQQDSIKWMAKCIDHPQVGMVAPMGVNVFDYTAPKSDHLLAYRNYTPSACWGVDADLFIRKKVELYQSVLYVHDKMMAAEVFKLGMEVVTCPHAHVKHVRFHDGSGCGKYAERQEQHLRDWQEICRLVGMPDIHTHNHKGQVMLGMARSLKQAGFIHSKKFEVPL